MIQTSESQRCSTTDVQPVIAFFDMDKTLLRASSATLYLRHALVTGEIPPGRWLHALRVVIGYVAKRTGFPEAMIRLHALAAPAGNDRGREARALRFESVLIQHIAPDANECVRWHKGQGHHVAIISAQLEQFVRPVAQAIGIGDAFVATQVRREGASAAQIDRRETPFGAGKVAAAATYAESMGTDLVQCYFYTDSYSDLPLLEAVGTPIAANPDRSLARIARERGWKIVRFF